MNSSISWSGLPAKRNSGTTPRRGRSPATAIQNLTEPKRSPSADVPSLIKPSLGPLECEVLQHVCGFGESTARRVLEHRPRPLAYTTVMTTMTRLHRKGLLDCRLTGRAFVYTSRLSSAQVELQLARDLVKALLACQLLQSQELAAAIVEAMRRERPDLLRELKNAVLEDKGIHGRG